MTITWPEIRPLSIAERTMAVTLAATAALAVFSSNASAQHAEHGNHPDLHVNPRWKECSFQLDPSLTLDAWRQFTGEAGVVTSFRPMVGARPLGRGRFELSVVQTTTAIDDHDAAWNDTFVHPDAEHWLYEGSGLAIPGITARIGITDETDVGVYFTKNPRANYGFFGGQVQQSLIEESRGWSAAARLSFVGLFGPEDLDFAVYGLDLVASREYALWSTRASVTPYGAVSTTLSRSHEKSAVVDLPDQNVLGAQATVGAAAKFSVARVAAEYTAARVSSFSVKVGFAR